MQVDVCSLRELACLPQRIAGRLQLLSPPAEDGARCRKRWFEKSRCFHDATLALPGLSVIGGHHDRAAGRPEVRPRFLRRRRRTKRGRLGIRSTISPDRLAADGGEEPRRHGYEDARFAGNPVFDIGRAPMPRRRG